MEKAYLIFGMFATVRCQPDGAMGFLNRTFYVVSPRHSRVSRRPRAVKILLVRRLSGSVPLFSLDRARNRQTNVDGTSSNVRT